MGILRLKDSSHWKRVKEKVFGKTANQESLCRGNTFKLTLEGSLHLVLLQKEKAT